MRRLVHAVAVLLLAAGTASAQAPVTEAEIKDLSDLLQVIGDPARPMADRTAALQKLAAGAPRTIAVFDAVFGKAQGDARISANESATLGDVRTVISAQAAYQSMNGGHYDTMRCLAEPAKCLPNYPASGPHFLDADLASLQPKSGYDRAFYPGSPVAAARRAGASASSISGFAYVAVPTKPGQTGRRAFCAEDNGLICVLPDASRKPVGGKCGTECRPIR